MKSTIAALTLGFALVTPAWAVGWRDLAPRASGMFLAEVVSIVERDDRSGDGDLYDEVSLKVLRTTGNALDKVIIVKASGGHLIPDSEPPRPRLELRPGDLVVGKQYWFVNPSIRVSGYPSGISGWWPVGDSLADRIFEDAIRNDVLRWSPTYEPESGLTYGLLVDPANKSWQVRVWDDKRVLWTRKLQGKRSARYDSWILFSLAVSPAEPRPRGLPESTIVLVAETAAELTDENEWELPAATYYIRYLLDARTGRLLNTRVFKHVDGLVELGGHVYDLQSGRVVTEANGLSR